MFYAISISSPMIDDSFVHSFIELGSTKSREVSTIDKDKVDLVCNGSEFYCDERGKKGALWQ
jgi:hypothetical protein